MAQSLEITQLLARAGAGETRALDALFAVVYDELRGIARAHLRSERAGHTLSATALVNEACIKLLGHTTAGTLSDRQHFFAVASRAMRQILLDHARARLAQKRGGADRALVTLGDGVGADAGRDPETLIALNDALTKLSANSERLGRIVELRYFAGLENTEIAELLGISSRTVQRDWRSARAFLSRELQANDAP